MEVCGHVGILHDVGTSAWSSAFKPFLNPEGFETKAVYALCTSELFYYIFLLPFSLLLSSCFILINVLISLHAP